jgi:hypothetical protein
MKFERKKMVDWFNPRQLAFTATKTVISGIFGNFADRREMQAALDPDLAPHDFSGRSELWIDFISDLGDGFNATYTMAHLMAQEKLVISQQEIKRGNILIMGGDQVYPTPELEEYDNRLRGPYKAAFPWVDHDNDRPSLFALPGNHDWYDGLTNFLRLFCQGRALGNWHSKQKRSYFALKLPHDTWLLGIDVQLAADIDYPQLCYFKEVASQFKANDKIILCTAEPSWVYQSFDKKDGSHDRLSFFINRILFDVGGYQNDKGDFQKNKEVEVVAILTGDLHHYSRYEEIDEAGRKRQLITAGGGGAFMHSTHTLKSDISPSESSTASLKGVFPPVDASRRLCWKNLFLAWYSPSFALFFGAFHLLTAWFLQIGSMTDSNFQRVIGAIPMEGRGWGDFLVMMGQNLQFNPAVLILNGMLLIGIYRFTDTKSGKKPWNNIAGSLHALLQVALFYLLYWWIAGWHRELGEGLQTSLFVLEMGLLGGIATSVLFGLYLLVGISLLDNHITEASSSYRWEGFKNFLRIHVSPKGLTIYPIGVEKIVKNWSNKGSEENPKFEGEPIDYQLIEQPIHIPFRTANTMQTKSSHSHSSQNTSKPL